MFNSFLCQRYGQLSFLQTKGDLTQPIPSVLFLKGHILAWGLCLLVRINKVKIKFSLLKVSASAYVNVYIQEMFGWEAKTGIEKIVCKQNCCLLPQCLLAESQLYFKTF